MILEPDSVQATNWLTARVRWREVLRRRSSHRSFTLVPAPDTPGRDQAVAGARTAMITPRAVLALLSPIIGISRPHTAAQGGKSTGSARHSIPLRTTVLFGESKRLMPGGIQIGMAGGVRFAPAGRRVADGVDILVAGNHWRRDCREPCRVGRGFSRLSGAGDVRAGRAVRAQRLLMRSSRGTRTLASGVPQPVTGSQPGPAGYPMMVVDEMITVLLPVVMSWKAKW
jgi:hypothetical protein